jgi:hypothetical protein
VRIFVAHRKKFRLFGPPRFEVVICVHFSEIEEEIIATHDLQRLVLLERMPTIFRDLDGDWTERDNNIYLDKFLTGMHVEPVASLSRAKVFQHELLLALEYVKVHFNGFITPDSSKATSPGPDTIRRPL